MLGGWYLIALTVKNPSSNLAAYTALVENNFTGAFEMILGSGKYKWSDYLFKFGAEVPPPARGLVRAIYSGTMYAWGRNSRTTALYAKSVMDKSEQEHQIGCHR